MNYCSGCHAPALLLSNESEHEVATAGDDLVAKSNIGCNACHAVKRINNTIGNGDYVLQRPRSYEHMSSDVEWYRRLFAFKLHVDPDPHKEFFLKPFMTRQNSEFCSSCHKLNSAIRQTQHLSIGGMNNYDSWQKSAFAGERIDAFKHVREHDCADCHMPRMRMDDPAAKRGTVHDHSFKYNILSQAGDDADDPIVQKYKINPIQLDVVAFQNLSKDGAPAPVNYFDEVKVNITPGSAVRMEVLVQSTEVGHDFPGRYSESMETWLEISVRDQQDRMVFQSGAIDDFNRIDEKAHRWGTVYRDRKGNIVTWPHGFSASDISYNHRIQPLTSEMVPYEFKIPENCGSELYISAQIKQRRRQTNEAELLTLKGTIATAVNGMHSGQYVDTHKIIAETEVKVSLPEQRRLNRQDDIPNSGDRYDIWFNYGIALYLKGEWDEAERAFLQAAKLRSTDVHLWLNLARTALDKNDFESMEIYLEKSQSIDPDLNKITYYRALMAEKQGDLDSAVTLLRDIRKDFYADRVFLLKLAEIQMKRNYYKRAGKWYKKILEFAPDDLDAHRGLREVYKNTGNDEGYQNEDKLVRALEKALLHE
ncbi:MAG: tetratricopeptide repeat protein [Calditrichaeota bacterium]|nr:MAG: tetratricopeptide repeat protein [Calditrichota bacterium]